jgi:arrestin-related trafficking adapter 3/6
MDEHESLVVERTWENQMQYLISISGKMFCLGGVIPIDVTFVPMAKVKIHSIAINIEE